MNPDDGVDTGVFQAITDDFLDKMAEVEESSNASIPPSADFDESDAIKELSKVQTEARQLLRNILFLTQEPLSEE